MSAKKRTDGSDSAVEVDALEPDMTKVSADFNLGLLLVEAGKSMDEASKRKIGLSERIGKNREAIARIETLIRNLQMKAASESGQVFVSAVLRPIQVELTNVFPNATVEVTGPYGMANATTLTVSKKSVNAIGKLKGQDSKSITFVPMADGKLGVRNFDEDSGEYPTGSLGAINGLNHPTVEVPAEGTIQFILEWLR